MNDRLHGKILHTLMESPLFSDEANLMRFEDDSGILRAAYISSEEEGVNLFCNLPTKSEKIFLTVSDGEPEKIARYMSHLEEVDATRNQLSARDVVIFSDTYLSENQKVGILLLPARVSSALNHVPDEISFEGKSYLTFLVVFIRDTEYEIWKEKGCDFLLDLFDRENRDLIGIAS